MLRLLTLVMVLVATALVAAACGQDDEEEATGGGQTVEVVGTEFAFDPSNIELDEAGTYTFHLVNDGQFEHALEIEGHGVEEATDVIGGGETADVTVELTEGEHEMYCPVGNHREMGMEGTVVVGSGGAGGATTEDETTTEEEDETTTEDDDMGY